MDLYIFFVKFNTTIEKINIKRSRSQTHQWSLLITKVNGVPRITLFKPFIKYGYV